MNSVRDEIVKIIHGRIAPNMNVDAIWEETNRMADDILGLSTGLIIPTRCAAPPEHMCRQQDEKPSLACPVDCQYGADKRAAMFGELVVGDRA